MNQGSWLVNLRNKLIKHHFVWKIIVDGLGEVDPVELLNIEVTLLAF